MNKRGRPRKSDYVTRDPVTTTRDPETEIRDPIGIFASDEFDMDNQKDVDALKKRGVKTDGLTGKVVIPRFTTPLCSFDAEAKNTCDVERERVVRNRQFRRYIPANMPTVCPTCGGNTRMADGKHTDPVRRTVLEYRTCAHCGLKLAAGRPMTAGEIAKHCGHVVAVEEYEKAVMP